MRFQMGNKYCQQRKKSMINKNNLEMLLKNRSKTIQKFKFKNLKKKM